MSQQDENEKQEEPVEVVEPEEPDVPQDVYNAPTEVQIEQLNAHLNAGLKRVGKTAGGLAYTFVELECEGKRISNLFSEMTRFQHLRKVNFTNNQISDASSLTSIKYLTHLNLRQNAIENLDCFNVPGTFEFLEELNLENNKLFNLGEICTPRLKRLLLANNKIYSAFAFKGHHSLEELDISNNKLETFDRFLNMGALLTLTASQNLLVSISHLEGLPKLATLKVNNNKLATLNPAPNLPKLAVLDLTANLIEKVDEFNHLVPLPSLRHIIVAENQVANEMGDGIRKEIIMILQQIERIGEDKVEDQERTDALAELKERIAAAILKKQEEEADAARLAEEQRLNEEAARQAELEKQQPPPDD